MELAVLAVYHPYPFSISECNLANYRYISLEENGSVGTSPKHLYYKDSARFSSGVSNVGLPFFFILGHFFNRLTSTPMSLISMVVLNDDSGGTWKRAFMAYFKVKGKAAPVQAMKTCKGTSDVVPPILNIATTPRPLYPRNKNPVPIEFEAILR